MTKISAGSAICALCHEALRPDEDAVVTPDFLADDTDPFYPYSDASAPLRLATRHRRQAAFGAWYTRFHASPEGPYQLVRALLLTLCSGQRVTDGFVVVS